MIEKRIKFYFWVLISELSSLIIKIETKKRSIEKIESNSLTLIDINFPFNKFNKF